MRFSNRVVDVPLYYDMPVDFVYANYCTVTLVVSAMPRLTKLPKSPNKFQKAKMRHTGSRD